MTDAAARKHLKMAATPPGPNAGATRQQNGGANSPTRETTLPLWAPVVLMPRQYSPK